MMRKLYEVLRLERRWGMKSCTKKKLIDILAAHIKYLKNEPGGEKANLHGANLIGADLHGANLRGANLRGANLIEANLIEADLSGADLRGADLHGANLRGAYLHEANLTGADLSGADLRGADLHRADLHGANLHGANLIKADLRGADLYKTNGIIRINIPVYEVLVTLTHAQIGCQYKTHKEWVKVSKEKALDLGLPTEYYQSFRYLVGSALKQLKIQRSK